jgi:hypothetical protein
LLYALALLGKAITTPLLGKISSSRGSSLSNIKKSTIASVDSLVLIAVLVYKPDSRGIFLLSDAVAILIDPTFLPPLG